MLKNPEFFLASENVIEMTTNSALQLDDGQYSITARQTMLDQEMNVGNNGSGTIDLIGAKHLSAYGKRFHL